MSMTNDTRTLLRSPAAVQGFAIPLFRAVRPDHIGPLPPTPTVRIARHSLAYPDLLGHYSTSSNEIIIFDRRHRFHDDYIMTLYHELCHWAVGYQHNEQFAQALYHVYATLLNPPVTPDDESELGHAAWRRDAIANNEISEIALNKIIDRAQANCLLT